MIFSKKRYFFTILLFFAFAPDNNFLLAQMGEGCSVCLDTFKIGERVCTLPCNHIFHTNCIIHWINEPLAGGDTAYRDPESGMEHALSDVVRYHGECPMCRERLSKNLQQTIRNGEIPHSMVRVVKPSHTGEATSIIAAPVIIQDEAEGASSRAGGASATLPEFLTFARNSHYPNEPSARARFESKLNEALRTEVGINFQDPESGNTALHWAVIHEKPWMAQILISNGASMEIRNNSGETPIDLVLSKINITLPVVELQKFFRLRD